MSTSTSTVPTNTAGIPRNHVNEDHDDDDDDDCYYATYLHWARNEAGIEASKVCIKGETEEESVFEDDRQRRRRRGLYATDTIYPGERIIFIPARALLGDHMLRQHQMSRPQCQRSAAAAAALQREGSLSEIDYLEGGRQESTRGKDSSKKNRKQRELSLEQMAMAMIEDIRQSLLQNNNNPDYDDSMSSSPGGAAANVVVRQAAEHVGYQWRPDDGVAMYLAVARFININNNNWNDDDDDTDDDDDDDGFRSFVVSSRRNDDSAAAPAAFGGDGDFMSLEQQQQEQVSQQLHAAAAPTVVLMDDSSVREEPPPVLAPAIPLQFDDESSAGNNETVFSPSSSLPPPPQNPDSNSIERELKAEHVVLQAVAVSSATADENSDDASIYHHPPPRLLSFLPHVQILPESFETSPLYYTAQELARIEGTNCHTYSVRMREQIQRDWMQLHHVLQAYSQHYRQQEIYHPDSHDESLLISFAQQLDLSNIVTLDAYKWALCNVYSRSSDFHITATTTSTSTSESSSNMMRVIAPLFDMMNHDFQSDLSHAMDQEGNISVFNGPNKTIQPGEEICLRYGNFGNEKLLFIYGFTVPENPFDVVSIYAPIRPSDPLHHVKARILQAKCGILDTNAISHPLCMSRLRQGKSILPESLLAVLRVVGIQTTDEILALAQPQEEDDDHDDDNNVNSAPSQKLAMISESNERRALLALHHALDSMSRRIALNLISDEGLQASSSYPVLLEMVVEQETTDRQVNQMSTRNTEALSSTEVSQVADANAQNVKILCQSELTILIAAMYEVAERLIALDGLCGEQQ
jgi:hypothetical protein